MNSIKRLKREKFYFSNYSFQICYLIMGMKVMKKYTKFNINISARPTKKHRDMGVNTIVELFSSYKQLILICISYDVYH